MHGSGQLRIASEQALNPESHVRLIDAVDRFGWRRVALDWRLSDVDLRTVRTAALETGKIFAKRDLGRIKLLPWVVDETAAPPKIGEDEVIGCHHMCTTRMSADPRHGVVDADCRLHAVENLYLGGSSVFATAGHSNPTYTIVQLALRLGEHLHSRLG
jgi:choline dehydrogenase-like flavoprotein